MRRILDVKKDQKKIDIGKVIVWNRSRAYVSSSLLFSSIFSYLVTLEKQMFLHQKIALLRIVWKMHSICPLQMA